MLFIAGFTVVNQQIELSSHAQYEETTSDSENSALDPTESGSGGNSESSSSSSSSDSSLNDNTEAALVEAELYFAERYYCRDQLIDLLEYDGFTNRAATEAVDSLNADWLEEAAGAAYSLYSSEGYTYDETLNTLYAYGCTQEEAEYGVSGLEG
jgi:hypothetical protein